MKRLENNKKSIIASYISGYTVSALSKQYKCSTWSIRNILLKNNIKLRTSDQFKIKYNNDFFKSRSPETAYFWGFMLGDGSLTIKNTLTITLHEKNISILENFCKWSGIDYSNIKKYENKNIVRLNIYDGSYLDILSKYGIVHNKTYNPIIPVIDDNMIIPFIIGLLDADGSITWDRKTKQNQYERYITLVGHPIIMDWVIKKLRYIGYDGSINTSITKKIWKRIRIQKKSDVVKLANILQINKYYDLCLNRKWEKLHNYILVNNLLKIKNPKLLFKELHKKSIQTVSDELSISIKNIKTWLKINKLKIIKSQITKSIIKPKKILMSKNKLEDLLWSYPIKDIMAQTNMCRKAIINLINYYKLSAPPMMYWLRYNSL